MDSLGEWTSAGLGSTASETDAASTAPGLSSGGSAVASAPVATAQREKPQETAREREREREREKKSKLKCH